MLNAKTDVSGEKKKNTDAITEITPQTIIHVLLSPISKARIRDPSIISCTPLTSRITANIMP